MASSESSGLGSGSGSNCKCWTYDMTIYNIHNKEVVKTFPFEIKGGVKLKAGAVIQVPIPGISKKLSFKVPIDMDFSGSGYLSIPYIDCEPSTHGICKKITHRGIAS